MTQHIQSCVFQVNAQFIRNNLCACQCCDISQLCFSSFTIARSFHSNTCECTSQFVQYQCSQCFAFYVFRDNQHFAACLHNLFQNGNQFLNVGDFLICQQDIRIFQNSYHFIHICAHVSGQITFIELHTFYQIQFCFHCFGFFYCDNAIVCYFFHSVSDHVADFFVTSGNCCNVCDMFLSSNSLTHFLDFCNSCVSCFLHTFSQDNCICACCDVFQTFLDHSLCQNSSVTGYIVCLCCNFFYQLCPHVFIGIFQFDVLCNGYTIICDQRRCEFSVQNYVTTFGAQCNFYGICQFVNTGCHCISCIGAVFNFFCHIQ